LATLRQAQEITDGPIAVAEGRKVRVRICDQRATLAVKSRTAGLANAGPSTKSPWPMPKSCSLTIAFVSAYQRPDISSHTVDMSGKSTSTREFSQA
jgi:CYTH domain-containing protein